MQNVTTHKPVIVHMDADLRGMLENLAREQDRSMSAVIRQLVRDAANPQPPSASDLRDMARVPDLREAGRVGLSDVSRPLVDAAPQTTTRPGRRSAKETEVK
jgi:hypothetical protein